MMKTLEKTVKLFILSAVQPMLDPLTFAYRAGRGIEDPSCSFWLCCMSTWRCCSFMLKSSLLTSLLFFNTMQPHILAQKLISNVSLQHDLVLWIVDLKKRRCQQVFVNMSSA